MPSLELTLFGGFRASLSSGGDLVFARRKSMLMLACLGLRPGETQTREKMIGLLWSDRGDAQARGSLRQALTTLRRALHGVAPAPLIIEGEQLWLAPGAVSVDVAAFEVLARSSTLADLEQATALYRGPLLDGIAVRDTEGEEWLFQERERLHELLLCALDRLLAMQLRDGALERATETVARILIEDPLREDAHRALMRLQARQGRHTLALRQYQICRDLLASKLGANPEPETEQLHQEIQRQRTSAPARPDGIEAEVASQRGDGPEKHRISAGRLNGDDAPMSGAPVRSPDTGSPAATVASRPAVAVLPFTNIGGDADQEYFADGLTEDLITDLSQVSGLFVVARHTAFTFKGRSVHVREAARELDVRYVLVGSVRKACDRVRINVQLVDGTTGGHVWAQRYDRGLDDIIAVQDEISKSVVDALKVKLLPEELETISSRATFSSTAYEYYLIGRSFYLRGMDRRSLTIAGGMFTKASEIDPRYARAHAAAALCESYLATSDSIESFKNSLAKVSRALELEPNLAEAYAVKGLVQFAAGRYEEAATEFDRAMHLRPDMFEAHFFYGRNCRLQGRHEEAAALFARAAELRPNDFRSMGLLAEQCKMLGRHDGFMSAAQSCLERLDATLKAYPDNADAWAFGSTILAELGQDARAEDWAVRGVLIAADDYIVHYNVARTFALLGRIDTALAHLEGAFEALPEIQRRLGAWMKHDEELAPLHDHPRFRALTQRLAAAASGTTAPATAASRPTIAVLPFRDTSGVQEEESFADGFTENIIADLSQVSALSVVAWHTAFMFKDRRGPAQQVAGELRVGHVLEGTVRKSNGRVRISTQLTDGETGGRLWARRYDRPLSDIFALEDEITKTVVDILRVKLLPGELESIASRPTANARAHEYYLMGRSFYLRGIEKRCLRIARGMFARASEFDPGFAHAYAGIAICDFYLAMSDPEASFESALANAGRALELDATLAEGYAAKGLALYAVGRYIAASAEFERALACDPNSFEAHFFYARNCRLQGLHRQAAALFERAAELRPSDFRSLGLLSAALGSLGRQAESRAAAQRCLERVEAEIKLYPDNADALAFGGALLAELGHAARAEDWAARALMIGPDDYLVQYNVARTYAQLGNFDDALQRLRHAFSTSPPCRRRLAEWMRQDEKIGPLRGDPRFQAFAQRLAFEAEAQA